MSSQESNEAHQLRMDLAVTKERLRHADAKIEQLTNEVEQLRDSSKRKDSDIQRRDDEYNRLNTILEVTKEKLKQTETALAQKNQSIKKKNRSLKLQAFLSSVLYLLATILTGFGINMITSAQSNPVGVTMIILGVVTYMIGTAMTIWITIESSE